MLTHPTTDRLRELGPAGMARALEEQQRHADAADLSSEDRLAMPVEREALERDTDQSPQDATADHVWPSRLPAPPSTCFVRGVSHDQQTVRSWVAQQSRPAIDGQRKTGRPRKVLAWLSPLIARPSMPRICKDKDT
jgi:hypothetical protein